MSRKVKSQKSTVKTTTQNSQRITVDFYVVVLTFTFFLLTFPTVAWGCPGCKESLFDPSQLPQRLATARGYALSIAVMLSVPLVLVTGVAALIFRAARHRR